MKYLLRYKLFENKSRLKFVKKDAKKDAKTEIYDVLKDGNVIGQVKWYSRLTGYAFLPEKEHDTEIKDFIKGLMTKRREDKSKH